MDGARSEHGVSQPIHSLDGSLSFCCTGEDNKCYCHFARVALWHNDVDWHQTKAGQKVHQLWLVHVRGQAPHEDLQLIWPLHGFCRRDTQITRQGLEPRVADVAHT